MLNLVKRLFRRQRTTYLEAMMSAGMPFDAYPGHAGGPIAGTAAAIVPAHNEEAVIEATILSLQRAFEAKDIFVFADGCTDDTVHVARRHLPAGNVIDHRQNVGKSRGLQAMLAAFVYPRRFEFVTIMDADSTVEPNFLEESLRVLRRPEVACTVGRVNTASYPHHIYGVYRAYMYWVWQSVVKRIQSFLHASTIASGTSTTWKTGVLRQLEMDHAMTTEDFNLTFQVHRRRLGKIKYVSSAVVWSEDPHTFRAFRKQGYRWSRAWWESVRRYRVGLKWLRFERGAWVGFNAVDIFTALLVFGMYGFWFRLFILPILLWHPIDLNFEFYFPSTRRAILVQMAFQYAALILPFLIVALITRQYRIFTYLPVMLALSVVDLLISLRALLSVLRHLYRTDARGGEASVWASPERMASRTPSARGRSP